MADPVKEEKPNVEGNDQEDEEHINVRVADQGGEELFFRIKKTTPMSRLMKAYAANTGKNENSFKFLYDGKRIQKTDTAEDLGMQDDDVIDLHPEQVGGAC